MEMRNTEQRQLIGNGGHKDIFNITIDGESKILYRISDNEFYSSIEEISHKYNVDVNDIIKNIFNGNPLINKNVENTTTKKHEIIRGFEHNGVFYESHNAFAKIHNLEYKKMMGRLKAGWTYEDCIAGKRLNKEYKKKTYTINGKTYTTLKEISVAFNISLSKLSYHLSDGKTDVEEFVNAHKKEKPNQTETSYIPRDKKVQFYFEGQPFCSEKQLCTIKGINYLTFAKRKSRGWTLQECVYGKK